MAGKTQKGKPKPKGKPAAKPKPVRKPGSKPTVAQARRLAARHERKEEHHPRHASPAPVGAGAQSESFLYKLSRFFWLLFHPGKTARDFAAQYRKS